MWPPQPMQACYVRSANVPYAGGQFEQNGTFWSMSALSSQADIARTIEISASSRLTSQLLRLCVDFSLNNNLGMKKTMPIGDRVDIEITKLYFDAAFSLWSEQFSKQLAGKFSRKIRRQKKKHPAGAG